MPRALDIHRHTPTVTAIDPRGLPARSVAYHRRDAGEAVGSRSERQAHNAAGRSCARWDARLWADGGAAGGPSSSTGHSLTGRPLQVRSADAGWHIELFDDAGHAREGWDSRGISRRIVYDLQRRPVSVHERQSDGPDRCLERFTYGDFTEWATNRCSRTLRHDDPSGSVIYPAYGVPDDALATTRRFLASLTPPDWPSDPEERDALLETDAHGAAVGYTTRMYYDAMSRAWQQSDAAGHVRRTGVDVAGLIVRTDFQPAGGTTAPVLLDTAYDAFGHAIAETAGNGVVTRSTWSEVDGRLHHRQVARQSHLLQDADYRYDPVGNITRIEDRAQPTTWFDGAQVDPVNTYAYDTLYQLIEATGRESVQATTGPALPGLVLPGGGDASRRRHYTQTYVYDAAGNLRALSHAASDQTQYTRTMVVAPRSNHSLLELPDAPPPDFAAGFDAHGNQQALDSGATLAWDARNQLQRVTWIARAAANDEEAYLYDGGGMRQRKVRTTQAGAVTHVEEVRYLPGLELRRNTATGELWEVASLPAGRGAARWLRWQSNGRKALPPPQWRYGIDDHLGSTTLELDGNAAVVSHEGYYPFGGSAWWAARSEVEASTKTLRYSGKERDATGLYYYGYRYYAPWLCRWISPDPAGDIDGLNRYRMVGNSPLCHVDRRGLTGETRATRWSSDAAPDEGVDLRPGALWGDSDDMRGPAGGYVDATLEQRLASRDELAGERPVFIAGDEFTHLIAESNAILAELMDPWSIDSSRLDGIEQFNNKYAPTEWTFKLNTKQSESRMYFASDVARHQYGIVARKNATFGILPPVIRRKHVVNRETLRMTEGLASRSPELQRTFLEGTPNGKTTQRILDDFGLQATSVVREDTFKKWLPDDRKWEVITDDSGLMSASLMHDPKRERTSDFVVHVKPASRVSTHPRHGDRHAPY